MINLTVSTNGMGRRPLSAPADEATTPECHKVEGIENIRYVAGVHDRALAVLALTPDQAAAVAYDLLYQMVDAGYIAGWNVQFPERDEKVPPVVPAYWNAEAQAYEV